MFPVANKRYTLYMKEYTPLGTKNNRIEERGVYLLVVVVVVVVAVVVVVVFKNVLQSTQNSTGS